MSENKKYQLYRQMTQGYRLGADGTALFEHSVVCWLDMEPGNPFPEDSPAHEHFFRMKNHYNVWRIGGADHKINRQRMLNAAKDLCATKAKNPYKYDKAVAEAEKAARKESIIKAREEEVQRIEKEEAEKAAREKEVQEILRELNQDDALNYERLEEIKAAIEEAEAMFPKPVKEEPKEETVKEEVKKTYVLGVPKEKEKKGWLKRLLKR